MADTSSAAAATARGALQRLDKLLGDNPWKGPPSDLSHLCEPEQVESFKALGDHEEVISKWITDTAERVLTEVVEPLKENGVQELAEEDVDAAASAEFRFCSIGCADGTLDERVMRALLAAEQKQATTASDMPTIRYVGIDIDEQLCELAEEKMEAICPGRLTAQVLAQDYQDLEDVTLQPFDVIVMTNFTYYCTSLEPALSSACRLLKPDTGKLIIVSSSRQSFDELITRFWLHQHKYDLCTTEFVTKALGALGIKHKIHREPVTFDLTRCFDEGFQTKHSQQILEHFTFAKVDEYPSEVIEACIEYLKSICKSVEGKKLITSLSDFIVVSKNDPRQ